MILDVDGGNGTVSIHLHIVDVGTKVTDQRTGVEIVIEDTFAARKGNVLWCTQKFADALLANIG
jgi:3D (Asp-Asp-Asp) domain-containing protein